MNIYHFHAFFCQEIGIKDSPVLSRIFEFLERMAGSRDPEVVNPLGVRVLEESLGYPNKVGAWEYMGPETKRLARKMAHAFRREANAPHE